MKRIISLILIITAILCLSSCYEQPSNSYGSPKNTFVEDGFIPDTKGAFVDFMWDKYTVKHNNITKEYKYDKTFVEALVKAHEDVAKDSAVAINTFVKFAGLD